MFACLCPCRLLGEEACWCPRDTVPNWTGLTGWLVKYPSALQTWMFISLYFLEQILACRNRASSVTWNPHKMMGVPLQCSAILVRRKVRDIQLFGYWLWFSFFCLKVCSNQLLKYVCPSTSVASCFRWHAINCIAVPPSIKRPKKLSWNLISQLFYWILPIKNRHLESIIEVTHLEIHKIHIFSFLYSIYDSNLPQIYDKCDLCVFFTDPKCGYYQSKTVVDTFWWALLNAISVHAHTQTQYGSLWLYWQGILQECNQLRAAYLFQPDKHYDVSYDTGDKTLQCGRHVDVFKFWLMWKAKVRLIWIKTIWQ